METERLPELNGWAALKAVVEAGSLEAAAKTLNIGQSAVTKRLRTLQTCYDLPLLARVNGRLQLTDAGKKVYALAAQTLEQQSALQREIGAIGRNHARMRLSVTHDIGDYFLPSFLVQFHECYSEYQLETRVIYYRQIRDALINRSSNLALMERSLDHPDVLVQKWKDDELWLVCGSNNPLAEIPLLPVKQLSTLKYVLREGETSLRETVDQAFKVVGVPSSQVELELGPTTGIIEILKKLHYVSFLPRFAVENHVLTGELHHIAVDNFTIQRSLWIARHRSDLKHPVAEALITMLRGL